MNKMSAIDIAWLAGLMEGEASIGAWNAASRKADIASKNTKYARVTVSSTDKEILDRVLELTGIGSIVLHYAGNRKASHKQSWTWTVGKAEDIIHLLCTVVSYGHFSKHREIQILEATEVASETIRRKQSGESTSRKKKLDEPLDQ